MLVPRKFKEMTDAEILDLLEDSAYLAHAESQLAESFDPTFDYISRIESIQAMHDFYSARNAS